MSWFDTDNGDSLTGKGTRRFQPRERTSTEVKQQTRPRQEQFDWEDFEPNEQGVFVIKE